MISFNFVYPRRNEQRNARRTAEQLRDHSRDGESEKRNTNEARRYEKTPTKPALTRPYQPSKSTPMPSKMLISAKRRGNQGKRTGGDERMEMGKHERENGEMK